jgi:hypothetical protein
MASQQKPSILKGLSFFPFGLQPGFAIDHFPLTIIAPVISA